MNISEIKFKTVYRAKEELGIEDHVFAYVRGWENGEVGFSVLEEATDNPDFSNCGVFWVRPSDFVRIFDICNDADS